MPKNWFAPEDRSLRQPQVLTVADAVLIACLIGVAVPVFVGAVGDSLARLMALPALVLLGFVLAFSRKVLLLLIILFRASTDLLFESTKLSLGSYQIGIGGLINVFVLLIALLLVTERPGLLPRKMVVTTWGAFLAMMLYGVAIAPAKVEAIRVFLQIASYFAMFVSAFYFVRSVEDFRFCVRMVLWSSVVPALYALVDIALNWGAGGLGGFRLQSTFTHPNIFAFYLTLIILLTLYASKGGAVALSTGKRLGLTAYMLFLLSLLLLTQTRSAWVASFAVFAMYALIFERRYLGYLIAAPLLALLIPSVQDRLLDLGTASDYVRYAQLNSFEWRRLIWESGLQWMRPDHYLLGYGVDSFRYFSPVFFPLGGKTNWGAHSVYVQYLFEIGMVGLLALLWLFGRLLWWLRLMSPIDKLGAFISIGLIIAYLGVSSSDNMFAYLAFNWYFWFIVGAACAVVAAQSQPRPGTSDPIRSKPRMSLRKSTASARNSDE